MAEKTLNETTGKKNYTHAKLVSTHRSLKTNLPYLFTYKKYKHLSIQNTTNSLDGGVFSPMKKLHTIHNRFTKSLKLKMVDDYLVGYKKKEWFTHPNFSLNQKFGLANKVGMSSILSGAVSLGNMIQEQSIKPGRHYFWPCAAKSFWINTEQAYGENTWEAERSIWCDCFGYTTNRLVYVMHVVWCILLIQVFMSYVWAILKKLFYSL